MIVYGPGVAAHVYNLSIWKTEAGRSQASLKKKKKSGIILCFSPLKLVNQHRCVPYQILKTHLSFYSSSQGLCGSESEVGNSRALPEGSGFPSL